MEATYLLTMQYPVYRRRDSDPGFRTELMRLSFLIPVVRAPSAIGQPAVSSIEGLLEKHVQARGGQAASGKITSQVRKGVYEVDGGNASYPMEVYAKAPDKWRFTLSIPGTLTIEHVSDGKTAWMHSLERTDAMPPANWAQDHIALNCSVLLRPRAHFPAMTVRGRENAHAREVWVVEANPRGGGNVPVEDSRFQKEANTVAYRESLWRTTREGLDQ